ALRELRDRPVERVAAQVDLAELAGEERQGNLRMDEGLQVRVLFLRLVLRPADEREDAGEDGDLVGRAPELLGPALDVAVERLRGLEVRRRRVDDLAARGREVAPLLRRARLEDHGMALWGPGDVQRPAHVEVVALVVEEVELLRVEEDPALLVA